MTHKKVLGTLFIIIAVVAIVFAYLCFDHYAGYGESDKYYGGDAYTGIQNAAAQTSRNVEITNQIILEIGSYAFALTGLVLASIGISMFVEAASYSKKSTTVTPLENKTPDVENTYTNPNVE